MEGTSEKAEHGYHCRIRGIRDKNGNYISAALPDHRWFWSQPLSGAGKALENFVTSNIDIKVRSIEINVLQRSGAHISSATDLTESFGAWSPCRRISRGRLLAAWLPP